MNYHWLSVFSILSAVLLADLATPPEPLWGDIRVKHTWNTVPANWESLGFPPAGTVIDLHIALTPQCENALIDALYEVSDPKHKKYGLHLSEDQVAELVAPHQDTLEIIHSWLEHHGVPSSSISTSHGGGWLTIAGVLVSQADELLSASYQLYRHTGTNETEAILRTVGYSLPAVLHGHVETVAPTTHFAAPRTALQTPRKASSEGAVVVNATSEELVKALSRREYIVIPSYLRWLYKTDAYVPAAMGQNGHGILGFETRFPSQEDLTRFMTDFRADATAATFTAVEVDGAVYDPSRIIGMDESVHTQYAAVIAYPTPQIFYGTGGPALWWSDTNKPAPGDSYLVWFDYLIKGGNIPPTISISNATPEPTLPQEYARALCRLFAQLGVRGITVLVTSGDDGVGRGDCKDSSGSVQFIPMFPASCPWVTSVGGTKGIQPEIAASISGGGFSNYFPRPLYQEEAVPAFLELITNGYAGLYRPEGRGVPDISARADNFVYVRNDVLHIASSTSCSTPTVAGIVSLLNDYLLSNGKGTLGFLNPLLYKLALAGVNDITRGSNPGCNTGGFPATAGWDPVTGVGTPDFESLLKILTYLIRTTSPPTSPEESRDVGYGCEILRFCATANHSNDQGECPCLPPTQCSRQ